MDGREIFNEILKSPRLRELLKVPADNEINANYDEDSPYQAINVIRNIIEGKVRRTGEDGIFNNIKRLFDL